MIGTGILVGYRRLYLVFQDPVQNLKFGYLLDDDLESRPKKISENLTISDYEIF